MTLDGEEFRGPDPKPVRQARKQTRQVDRSATARACLTWRECAACGKPSATGHHVIPKAPPLLGDDVIENIVPLCGSGTTGCHGLIENEDAATRKAVGKWISERRPDLIAYVREKLGKRAGDDYLRRHLYVSRKR